MIAKAEAKYIRMSPRKAGLVVALIKGKTVEEANFILDNVNKMAAVPIRKVLSSAFANANFNRQEKFLTNDLYISQLSANGGPMLVRYRAATMGRATSVRHRTTHLKVELEVVPERAVKIAEKSKKKKKTKAES
ncbi:MAG TPA: 50S ribosomal protein L22 [Candidatus Omnitrophota bacterium]|nr:50S ribosomal protein L22 [Candidatus Omnitrophota bacterium]